MLKKTYLLILLLIIQKAVSETKKDLERQKDLLKERNQDIQSKLGEKNQLGREDQEIQLEMKELEHQMAKFQRDSKDAANKVNNNQGEGGVQFVLLLGVCF